MLYTPLTIKAMRIAYDAHHGQTDKAGAPYIFHPARVSAGFTEEAKACVAWLHDVIEDTELSIRDIRREGFGDTVCDALLLLTHDKSVPYMEYVKRIARDPVARAVKLADLTDNMDISRLSSVTQKDRERLEKYRAAYAYLSKTPAEESVP